MIKTNLVLLVIFLLPVLVLGLLVTREKPQVFSDLSLAEAKAKSVEQEKILLVDVTADWCLTCHLNKAAVINTSAIRKLLRQENIIPMRADWTTSNKKIANFLKRYDRYGIPFNIIFGPNAPEGIVLSELLTAKEVKSKVIEATSDQTK